MCCCLTTLEFSNGERFRVSVLGGSKQWGAFLWLLRLRILDNCHWQRSQGSGSVQTEMTKLLHSFRWGHVVKRGEEFRTVLAVLRGQRVNSSGHSGRQHAIALSSFVTL
jgi:hypothetical protein